MPFKILSKVALCFFAFSTLSLASALKEFSFFEDKPRSLAKDFYIYEYLKSSKCTPEQAWSLLEQASRMNMKLFHAFADKLNDEGIAKASKCMKLGIVDLLNTLDKDCIAIGISIYEATKLDKKLLSALADKLEPYPEAIPIRILASKNIYESMINGNADEFFEVFNKVGNKYREDNFDKPIAKIKIEELEKDWRINSSIKFIVTDLKLKNIQKSLLHVNPEASALNHLSLFYLGLNALKLKQKDKALAYFDKAYDKAYYQMDRDKVLFWQYETTKSEKYKKQLQESFDLNIYTILAGKKDNHVMIAKAYEPHPFYDEKDPFSWLNLLKEMKDKKPDELDALAQIYLYGSTLPHFSFIMEKASKYKDHYFPRPYREHIKEESTHRQALIYAIARQESRFVPASISTSYALGMMQFMPFLANAIAKQEGIEDFDLEDMFEPKTALKFANTHLDYLETYLHNPLFVAYAYNGGIGFTKRMLQSGLFQDGPYEPFMSMELVNYDESRKYAKKVLANYIIYRRIYLDKVNLYKLFEDLTNPNVSDKFRKKP